MLYLVQGLEISVITLSILFPFALKVALTDKLVIALYATFAVKVIVSHTDFSAVVALALVFHHTIIHHALVILGAVTVHEVALLYIVHGRELLPTLVAQFVLKVAVTVFEKIAYTVVSSFKVREERAVVAFLFVFHQIQVYPLFDSLHIGRVTDVH